MFVKAPKEIRGRVVSLQQWAITWGILIQYFIQYGASFTGGGASNVHQGTSAFRIPWAVQIVPAAVLFVGMFFMPYSTFLPEYTYRFRVSSTKDIYQRQSTLQKCLTS